MNSGIMLRNSECEVISFAPEDRLDIIKKLYKTKYDHVNYDNINWLEYDCISALMHKEKIVGFSSIWHRSFYEEGEVRILNRYWENRSLRREGRELARSHIIKMVFDQIKFAKDAGYTKAFISRENNPRVFRELINKIAHKTNTVWHIHDERVPVCKGKNCLQYKGYTIL